MNHDLGGRDPGACPRRSDLEAVLSEDIEAEQRARILSHVEACPACGRTWKALESERRQFFARHPFGELATGMERLERNRKRRRMIVLGLVPAGAAAVAILIGAWLALPSLPGVRSKGSVALFLYLMRSGEIRPAQSDDVFAPRDRIQFLVSSGGHRYLLLVSVDDAGRLFNYTPGASDSSASITPGDRRPLQESVELDESRETERVFALFSDEPLSLAEIRICIEKDLAEVRRRGGTVKDLERLSGPWPQASVLLRKR